MKPRQMDTLSDKVIAKQRQIIEEQGHIILDSTYDIPHTRARISRLFDDLAELEAQLKEQEEAPKLCPNCKEELDSWCACMRNTCIKCGKPVGNITFTVCDDCWDWKPFNKPQKP